MSEQLMGMAAEMARETASEICEETPGRWATREELIEMAHRDAEDHHAKGYDYCRVGNRTFDEAYKARREALEAEPVTAASVICAEDVMRRLLELPAEIAAAERDVIKCESNVLCAKHVLEEEEYALLTGDNPPSGKNAETRAIQTAIALAPYRNTVAHHEESVKWVRMAKERLQNEFAALKAIARMLEARS